MNLSGLRLLKKYFYERSFLSVLLVSISVIGLFPGVSRAVDVTLAWDANTETDLAGYVVYYGTTSGVYSNNIDVGNTTQHTLSNLPDGITYYLAVTAYDVDNSESDYSAEVVYTANVNAHTIAASAGAHGSIAPSGSVAVANEANQSFSISADPSYQILEVLVDGVSVGAVSSYSFENVTANHTISASFISVNQASNDSDGDGVPDDQDDFPYDAAETTDTDGDGQGNNADTDDDNDGMPDAWELVYGLNPLMDDAAADPDGDEVSNLDEFLSETDPTQVNGNSQPNVPTLISPIGYDLATLNPTLQVDNFNDPDSGDFHAESEWQIFWELNNNRKCVFELRSASALTSLQVPALILDEKKNYSWQVRFYDNYGRASDWSSAGYFATSENFSDTDSNGIMDDQEVDSTVDLDGNGIDDLNELKIKCVRTKGNSSKLIGLSIKDSPKAIKIVALQMQDQYDQDLYPAMVAPPGIMPFGLVDFKVLVENPGDTAELTVYFSEEVPQGSVWYKYDSIEKVWDDFSDYAVLNPNQRSLKLYLEDGGPGDADRIANGIIVDPSGLISSSSLENSTAEGGNNSSGSSGCFINALQGSSVSNSESDTRWVIIGYSLLFLLPGCLFPIVKRSEKIRSHFKTFWVLRLKSCLVRR